MKGFRLFVSSTYKSGLRYTPQRTAGVDERGRLRYEPIEETPFTRLGSSWFWTDLRLTRDFMLVGRFAASASVEVSNVFNSKNAQIVNPVTGTAFQAGDALPYGQRDPAFPGPRDGGLLPSNPARYLQPRQILFGISVSI